MTWEDISTAPRDGRTLLLCIRGFEPCTGCWHEDKWITGLANDNRCENEDCFYESLKANRYEPTHWQPLPEPPKNA